MIKVKDGYAKLIGTTYQGSATQVLLSNGGNLEFSSATKANTLVQRNASQHIYATYFNSKISDEALTDIGSVYVRNTSDTFIRRISKTQFYSIIDNKFVTLDTAQTITGVKTFAASFFLDKSASLIQNQKDSSNYTTAIRWYKGGTSQGTYNPSIGQHNTGGDGKGSICILPYPTETSPWGGTVGLFISKGVLKLDGKSVALAENYYTKTESDERYVNVTGDTMTGPLIVKATVTGTQLISTIATGTSPLKVTSTTVVTNLNSDLFDGFHETAFVRSFWTSSPGYDCSKYNSRPLISFTYSNNAPFTGGFIDVVTNGYGFYLGTSYTSNAPLYYKRHGISSDGGMGTWQQLARITDNVASATKLQTARTINGTLFDGTANITTAYWGTARTITLSGAVTGSASVNGSQNVTITTTYQTGSIDGRYVGGNKTANHGSSGTAYTADSYSSTFARKEFVAFAERGSWAYANNGYVTTDTGVNIPLAGTAVFQWGASDTNKTQLFITPHNNSGVSNPAANEMLFYTSNGSGYTSAWTRVLTHRNYTAYTVTKTGGGASGTWGISITGSAPWANITGKPTLLTLAGITSLTNKDLNYARYNFGTTNKGDDSTQLNVPANYGLYLSLAYSDKNQGGQIFFNTVPGTTGTLYFRTRNAGNGNTVNTWKSWKTVLDSTNYTAYFNPANYVTALGTSGNYVTWTKNGATNNLTVPYATKANRLTLVSCYNGTTNNDLWSTIKTANSTYMGTATIYEVYNDGGPTTYGEVLDIVSRHSNHWQPQLWFDSGKTGSIRHRNKNYNNATWGSWYILLDTNNYPGLLDGRYVTLTTAQTVSGVKTFSTQQKFTVATGTSPFTVTSTTVVTNLNSDLLDGRHLGNATGRIPYIVSFPAYSSFGSSTSTLDYEKNILKWIWTNQNHGGDTLLIGVGRPNSIGNLQIQLYGTSGVNSSTGYPKYSSAIYYPLGGRPICFGTTDYNFYSYSLAFSNDIKDPANYYWANIKVSASSSTATQPTFNTCYTSNWFRSQGGTGWYNQSYAGGVYMNENYWVKTYGGTMMYIAPDAHAWGIGGHNIAMKLYHSSHIGINFATSAYTWGIYANGNGNMYIGRRTGNVNDGSGTYYHTLTASYISSPGFYHSAIGSNSYVLLAGGSYKGLGDFAKGNAGSATKGVYVTRGTVTAMTYSLSSNLNSGTSGKLAYYSSATTVAAYTSSVGATNRGVYMNAGVPTVMTYYLNATVNSGTSGKLAYYSSATTVAAYTSSVGATNRGVYMNAGVPTVMTYYLNATVNSGTSGKLAYYSSTNALSSYTTTVGSTHQPVYMSSGVPTICGYSFKGSSRQPIVLLSGVFYRSNTTWYMDSARTHKVVDATPSITISGARMQITLPGTTISSGVVTQEQTTDFSASSTADVNSQGNGAYGFAVYSNAANYVYVRTWCQRNDKNHSWASDGKSWTTFLMRIQVTLFGYIN